LTMATRAIQRKGSGAVSGAISWSQNVLASPAFRNLILP
jgi:hypothetical protein